MTAVYALRRTGLRSRPNLDGHQPLSFAAPFSMTIYFRGCGKAHWKAKLRRRFNGDDKGDSDRNRPVAPGLVAIIFSIVS